MRTVNNAHGRVLLAKEEAVLQGTTGRVTETERRYGMEVNVEKAKVIRTQGSHPHYRLREIKNSRRMRNISTN
jgi:hypothetical protein